MSKKIQSVQEVLQLKQGYFGYLYKRTFQTFFKISGSFANHPDNLESPRLIKKHGKFLFTNLKNPVSQKSYFKMQII